MFEHLFFRKRAVYVIIPKSVVELDRPRMTIWGMHILRRVPKATNTLSDYVIIIAFLPQ